MMYFTYGTKVFTKFMGYYGQNEECPVCHKVYKKAYVRHSKWAHFDGIPIFRTKRSYNKLCPICGHGYSVTGKEGKAEMAAGPKDETQKIEVYAKRILAKKPKKLLEQDKSYELWVKDVGRNEETMIADELSKAILKSAKKDRGLKKIPIIEV